VQGDGFFVVKNGAENVYTRAGAFTFDTSVDLTQDALTERGLAGAAVAGG